MDPKSDEGILLGYYVNSRAYNVYNNQKNTIMESINVVIDYASQIETSDEEEDYILKNHQNVTPYVPRKGTNIM